MTTIPTYEQACEAKNAGAPQPKMAAGQYWYNQFGVLWYIHLVNLDSYLAHKTGTYEIKEIKMKDFDSVIYAAGPHLNEV